MKPIVAIVGRPNVGKSTLFNRIAGGRKAIVYDQPGVTRDRNYADIQWGDIPFTLVDTGGFEPVSKDRIFAQMAEQCQLAMEEADAILFIMDGREGLTPSDIEIADLLRRQDKPVFFAINKIDLPEHEEKVYEFYQLGTESLYPISAEHRTGIETLVDEVVKCLPRHFSESEGEEDDKKAIRVAIIGRPNVGKSSLVNRLLGYKRVLVDEAPGTTRDAIDTPIERDGKRYILIDTAGIRRKSRIALKLEKYSVMEAFRTIDRSDVVLLLLDSAEGVTDQDARVGGLIHDKGRGCIVLVNKWDLIEKDSKTQQEFEAKVREGLRGLPYAPILFISAKTGQRIHRILARVDEVAGEARKRIPTASLNRYFGQWTEKLPPPLFKGRTVKLNYITQVAVAPPTFLVYANLPEGVHSSYERYLIHQMRETFSFEGVPIRLFFRKKRKDRQDAKTS